jgi:hypothetical protein
MALKKCRECGKDVSTAAVSCPHCGCVLKKKRGCLSYFGGAALILIVVGVLASQQVSKNQADTSPTAEAGASASGSVAPQASAAVYQQGQTIHVGYTSYLVSGSWWSTRLSSNQFLDQRPNARYLFVDLTVRNDDTKPRTVPPFKLNDDNGAEYDASDRGLQVEGSIGIIENLNPSVSKRGYVVFDVPSDRNYRLKLSGGYWSSEAAFVRLNPRPSP